MKKTTFSESQILVNSHLPAKISESPYFRVLNYAYFVLLMCIDISKLNRIDKKICSLVKNYVVLQFNLNLGYFLNDRFNERSEPHFLSNFRL